MTSAQFLLSAWTWNPAVLGVCVLAGLAYVLRFGAPLAARTACFIAAVAIFFLTLASPLNALADGLLFSAHMAQHLLLLLVIPLLLVAGLPAPPQAPAGAPPRRFRPPPLLGWVGGVGAMWVWHERTLCDLATRTEGVRIFQILSLLVLGTLFWWPLLGPDPAGRIPPLKGVMYLLGACIACSVLGILVTFSPLGAVCPVYQDPSGSPELLGLIRRGWGLTPAKDQQLGGLLMWLPGCGIYLAGVLGTLARWYRSSDSGLPAGGPSIRPEHPEWTPVHLGGKRP